MERYDYLEAMKNDIREYIDDNYTSEELAEALEDVAEFESTLCDDLWIVDSVTGNASGSYFFNAWRAEEAVCHNLDLLGEAMREFCCDVDALSNGAEWCDVTIRCYLIGQAVAAVLEDLTEEA
jgi:uncharacterized protein with HEPN domain